MVHLDNGMLFSIKVNELFRHEKTWKRFKCDRAQGHATPKYGTLAYINYFKMKEFEKMMETGRSLCFVFLKKII